MEVIGEGLFIIDKIKKNRICSQRHATEVSDQDKTKRS